MVKLNELQRKIMDQISFYGIPSDYIISIPEEGPENFLWLTCKYVDYLLSNKSRPHQEQEVEAFYNIF